MNISIILENIFNNFIDLNDPNINNFLEIVLKEILKFQNVKEYNFSDIYSPKTAYVNDKPYFVTLEGGPDKDIIDLIKSNENIEGGLKLNKKRYEEKINIIVFDKDGNNIETFDLFKNNINEFNDKIENINIKNKHEIF
jgi:methionine synthase II (cobalamin-independent)